MRVLLLALLVVPMAACASAKAKTPEVRVPLDVPPPPPRVIEPLPSTEPALEPVAELPPPSTSTPRPRPTSTKEPNRTEPPKTEAKPETTATDPATAAPTPATPPVPPLRTPGSAEGPAATKQVREALDRAKQLLNSIDERTLNGDRLANYQQARLYLQQSEDALKSNNIIQAQRLADRAEQIAGKLR
jgi:hypothetical protein